MLRLLLFMHHVTLCTPCIALFNCDHLFAYTIDLAELKSEIQAEQVQWVFRGPQASIVVDANIVVIKASPGVSNPILEFYFS
jgi:hypothetical protein